jgi:hypothetical protein
MWKSSWDATDAGDGIGSMDLDERSDELQVVSYGKHVYKVHGLRLDKRRGRVGAMRSYAKGEQSNVSSQR